jgi:GntR family transcriptional regulator
MADKKLTLHLDFRSGLPIYTQIVNQIQSQLANGILEPGDQLPTVRALAQELRVNFNTVARAYRLLDETHIISTQQGRERLRHESLEALTDRFISEAFRLGFSGREISQMVKDNLKTWKDAQDENNE